VGASQQSRRTTGSLYYNVVHIAITALLIRWTGTFPEEDTEKHLGNDISHEMVLRMFGTTPARGTLSKGVGQILQQRRKRP
jgi:hypothetical protein